MDQKKIYTHQLVAEVLSQMRTTEVYSLPVYDKGQFIGRITYEELTSFLNHNKKTGNVEAHKLNFDIGTALHTIKRINPAYDKKDQKSNLFKSLVIGLSSVAAVALLLIGLTQVFFKQDATEPTTTNTLAAGDTEKVVLTLINGKNVALNEAKKGLVVAGSNLNYSDGSKIAVQNVIAVSGDSSDYVKRHGNASVHNNAMVLSVPRTGMYHVVLPDGSKVWLNSASTLKFPATFDGATKRRVELNGEAYFEIAKVMLKSQDIGNKERRMPFIVVTDKQEIEVLGTHFNVNAYQDEKIGKTTLVEGSVRVRPLMINDKKLSGFDPSSLDPLIVEGDKVYGKAVMLKPNEEAVLKGRNVTVNTVDATEAFAWKDGEYIFRNMPMESIMRMVTRWYNVDVIYQNKKVRSALLGGAISKSSNIKDVLKMLELTANVHFKIEGKRITVIE
ncbi:FecR family protein [Pedobacter nyackensis]|uniref:FecR family protein n=1 Tax=Pedobacter nyackensis TaxID=475255 RepID=UPI002930CBAA|nr:FecR domain-containing protein [Pedobacter nyackensis]